MGCGDSAAHSYPSDLEFTTMTLTPFHIALGALAMTLLTIFGAWLLGAFEGLGVGGGFALVFGVTVSYAVGIGLMAAVFYSNRGHDQAAHDAALERFKH
jgi:hypothetical protein